MSHMGRGETPAARRTIVFCCNSLWGLVNFRGRVIRALVDDGHRVVLVGVADVPLSRVAETGATFIEWQVAARGANPLREFAALWGLVRLYRTIKPEIAFHFTVKPVLYGTVAARLVGARAISVITGLGYLFLSAGPRLWFAHALYQLTLGHSRELWFLNSEDRSIFEQAGLTKGKQVETLPGEGIDIRHFAATPLPPATHTFVFLMMARLLRDKGVMEFAEAARSVRRRHPQARFRLLGPSYDANDMSVPITIVRAWEEEGILEYLGATDDVRPAIAACHCVVLPSYREGMPRVLMEAAAMARPVIATDVTGCRDAVVAGVTGLLCAPRDSASLAAACEMMIAMTPDALSIMAGQARRTAEERFDDAAIISRYRDVVSND